MKYILGLLVFLPQIAQAHVKWFSQYDYNHVPLGLSDLNTPTFWGLFVLSILCMPLLVWLDRWAESKALYRRINAFLDRYSEQGPLIMRVAMGAVFLMSWQSGSIVAPEILAPSPVWGWVQFLFALLLLFEKTTIFAGLGMVVLFLVGVSSQGIFHMLDYMVYPAVGLYLMTSYLKWEKIKNLDLPILYSGLGFSLCWVAFEKLIYPYWGLSVISTAPELTMGLDPRFFLEACAFVEFSLGYLLIICLLHRPLAIIVTLTFFTTTCFFGKTEIVGHTILHGALLVFIVKGPGHYYQAPIRIHRTFWMRSLFAAINFVVLFFLLALPYEKLAKTAFEASKALAHPRFDVQALEAPTVMLHAKQDVNGGWNLQLMTEKFKFSPEHAGGADVLGEGHAHLFVNGVKVSRIYGEWFHLSLEKGKNVLRVTLNTNTHRDYYVDGKPVEAVIEVEEGRAVSGGHHH